MKSWCKQVLVPWRRSLLVSLASNSCLGNRSRNLGLSRVNNVIAHFTYSTMGSKDKRSWYQDSESLSTPCWLTEQTNEESEDLPKLPFRLKIAFGDSCETGCFNHTYTEPTVVSGNMWFVPGEPGCNERKNWLIKYRRTFPSHFLHTAMYNSEGLCAIRIGFSHWRLFPPTRYLCGTGHTLEYWHVGRYQSFMLDSSLSGWLACIEHSYRTRYRNQSGGTPCCCAWNTPAQPYPNLVHMWHRVHRVHRHRYPGMYIRLSLALMFLWYRFSPPLIRIDAHRIRRAFRDALGAWLKIAPKNRGLKESSISAATLHRGKNYPIWVESPPHTLSRLIFRDP